MSYPKLKEAIRAMAYENDIIDDVNTEEVVIDRVMTTLTNNHPPEVLAEADSELNTMGAEEFAEVCDEPGAAAGVVEEVLDAAFDKIYKTWLQAASL